MSDEAGSAQVGNKSHSFGGGYRLTAMKQPAIDDIVDTIYLDPEARYVVALIVGYSEEELQPVADGSPLDQMASGMRKAAFGALELTRDAGSGGTHWYVWDRLTESGEMMEQRDFEHTEDDDDKFPD